MSKCTQNMKNTHCFPPSQIIVSCKIFSVYNFNIKSVMWHNFTQILAYLFDAFYIGM